jgi:DNA repair protein RecN (Recombination protein N)
MLLSLSVQDFVIVDRLRLEFSPGFTVLTGETGAGKSILVDALLLVLGARGDASVVRAGCEKAEITAEFDIGPVPAVATYLSEQDLATGEGECILRRVIDGSGRSRAFVNGRPTTVAQLRELGMALVDIHGQHEHQTLVRVSEQRALLDAFANALPTAAEVLARFRVWQEAKARWHAAVTGALAAVDERDRLSWQIQELQRVALPADAWTELQSDHDRLANAATLIEGTQRAIDLLSENDVSAASMVDAVSSAVRPLASHDRALEPVMELLQSAEIQISEAAHALRHYRERLELDPARLKEVEGRLEAVVSAARKYRVDPESLAGKLAELEARQAALASSLDVEGLERATAEAEATYRKAAAGLTKARLRAASTLSKAVTEAMQQLAMEGGAFEVALVPEDVPAAHGLESVEFRFRGHAGMATAPVSRIASGGELSRLSLAIQAVTSQVAPVPTQIFDEVDSGIGGAVAEVVGAMLRRLGNGRQVLCITHLAQVAAAADRQWRVAKRTVKGTTQSTVEPLDDAGRVEELARMMGGVKITETTRRHAAEMLARHGEPG